MQTKRSFFNERLKLCHGGVTPPSLLLTRALELYGRSLKPDLSDRGKAAAHTNSVLFSGNDCFSTVNLQTDHKRFGVGVSSFILGEVQFKSADEPNGPSGRS